jgi:hypothetical protein
VSRREKGEGRSIEEDTTLPREDGDDVDDRRRRPLRPGEKARKANIRKLADQELSPFSGNDAFDGATVTSLYCLLDGERSARSRLDAPDRDKERQASRSQRRLTAREADSGRESKVLNAACRCKDSC